MKSHRLLTLAVAGLTGCASLLQTPPRDELHTAYVAMKEAVAISADDYDAADMNEARQRYTRAWQIKDSEPAVASRLARQSQVLAELAQAKAEAAIAAQQRKAAQAEVTTLEQMARPTGKLR